jgi:hypothetical protein
MIIRSKIATEIRKLRQVKIKYKRNSYHNRRKLSLPKSIGMTWERSMYWVRKYLSAKRNTMSIFNRRNNNRLSNS